MSNTLTIEEKKEGTHILKREQIEGTPFTIVHLEHTTLLTIGNYKLREGNEFDLREEVEIKGWNLLIDVMSIVIESMEKLKNELNNIKTLNND